MAFKRSEGSLPLSHHIEIMQRREFGLFLFIKLICFSDLLLFSNPRYFPLIIFFVNSDNDCFIMLDYAIIYNKISSDISEIEIEERGLIMFQLKRTCFLRGSRLAIPIMIGYLPLGLSLEYWQFKLELAGLMQH